MKKFILYLSKITFVIIILMVVFDALYTYVYSNSVPVNKSQYVIQLKNKTIDYIFLGSSRVENHIVTELVEKQTGKTAINLGEQGAKLSDTYLIMKLLVANKISFKKVFIQVDYNFNDENSSVNSVSESLPFIRTNAVVNEHSKSNNKEYFANYYVPFYRFAAFDYKIGFRGFFSALVKKTSPYNFENGFDARKGVFDDAKYALPLKVSTNNKIFDSIKKFCNDKNIDVVYYCSPFCNQVVKSNYTKELKIKISELKDYSKSILDTKYFINCGHLNEDGAKLFTQMIIDDCIKNEK